MCVYVLTTHLQRYTLVRLEKIEVITSKRVVWRKRGEITDEKIDPHFRADGYKRNARSVLYRNLSLAANRYSFAKKGNLRQVV